MTPVHSLISSDPEVLLGKPVIRGTRISVELVLDALAGGATIEDLLDAYPHISREQILAALAFAADALRADVVYPYEYSPA